MANQPTLRRRMILSLGCMVLGSLAIGGASLIAVTGLHEDLSISTQGYRQLRQVFNVGFLASKAREDLGENPPRPDQAAIAMQSALDTLNARFDSTAIDGPPEHWVDESERENCRQLMIESIEQLKSGSTTAASLNHIFGSLSKIADEVRQSISDAQSAADHKQQLTLISILSLVGVVTVGVIVIGIRHYRRVTRPIDQLTEGVRNFTAGNLDRRLNMTGDREFVALADDFDKMAEQLSALYRDLEAKVAAKSKELVRSEQLAAVGYLAAGVAHEINNPLGIIAGYAERAMQQLPDEDSSKIKTALAIICQEAFRCKEITSRLLSLARPGSENRQILSLAKIAEAVVATLAGLGTVQDRDLMLTLQPHMDSSVSANEGEMKQLLLNLIINAMEAVDPEKGRVVVNLSRQNDEIELSVTDNGHGMTPETLDRIFQPFFSEKRGQRHGTGLGLSIAQAIVTDHGGVIEANSGGVDTGSTFTVRLPVAKQEVTVG